MKLFNNDINTCEQTIAAIESTAIFSPIHSMYETKNELCSITTSFVLDYQPHF